MELSIENFWNSRSCIVIVSLYWASTAVVSAYGSLFNPYISNTPSDGSIIVPTPSKDAVNPVIQNDPLAGSVVKAAMSPAFSGFNVRS